MAGFLAGSFFLWPLAGPLLIGRVISSAGVSDEQRHSTPSSTAEGPAAVPATTTREVVSRRQGSNRQTIFPIHGNTSSNSRIPRRTRRCGDALPRGYPKNLAAQSLLQLSAPFLIRWNRRICSIHLRSANGLGVEASPNKRSSILYKQVASFNPETDLRLAPAPHAMGVYAGVSGIRVLPDPLRRHSFLSSPGTSCERLLRIS